MRAGIPVEERSSSLTIAIAPFDGCPNVSDDLTEALEQHFADSLSVQKRASEAPDDSATEDLSLFISGSCDQNGEVTSKFELLEEMREVPELYHPRTLTIEESDQNPNTNNNKRKQSATATQGRRVTGNRGTTPSPAPTGALASGANPKGPGQAKPRRTPPLSRPKKK